MSVSVLKRSPLFFGLILIFAFTWPIDLGLAANSRGWLSVHIPPVLGILVGYGFVAASILATGFVEGRAGISKLLQRFLIWRVGWRWYTLVLLGPLALTLAAIGFNFLSTGAAPDFKEVYIRQILGPSSNLRYAIIPWFLFELFTNGEEIGWRGYTLPHLNSRFSALTSSLVLGLVWGIWHLPKFLLAGSNQSQGIFWLYLLDTTAKAVLYTWVFNNTNGSLLLVTLLHAAWNTSGTFLPIGAAGVPLAILNWLAALAIIVITGPEDFSHKAASQVRMVFKPPE